jgi:DNA invertase Pin-like site-specific DNA recombinase
VATVPPTCAQISPAQTLKQLRPPFLLAVAAVEDLPASRASRRVGIGETLMGVFAEFERAMIQERGHARLARARAEGKVLGRPTVGEENEAEIQTCLKRGWGLIKTAKHVGVGTSVVQRVRAAMNADPGAATKIHRSA